jgi:photosystem II stability/assembly factor-like uncharacterized protein
MYDERTNGVYRSDDGGLTWTLDNSGLSKLEQIVPVPGVAGALYAETDNGLLRSNDNGKTWEISNSGLPSGYVSVFFDPSNSAHVFAICGELSYVNQNNSYVPEVNGQSLFVSQDSGQTWSQVVTVNKLKLEYGDGEISSIAVDPSNSQNIYIGITGSINGSYVCSSYDGGKNWQSIDAGYENYGIDYVLVDPQHPQIIYAGSAGELFKSSDSGKSFSSVGGSNDWGTYDGPVFNLVVFDPANPNILVAETDLGVYQSSDEGVTWNNKSIGFIDAPYEATNFVVSDGSGKLYAGTEKGLFLSIDSFHQIWKALYTGTSVYSLLFPTGSESNYYIGTGNGLMMSTDNGQTWTSVRTGLSSDTAVFAVIRDPYDANHLFLGTSGLITSTDGGKSWHPSNGNFNGNVKTICADNTIKGRFFVLDSNGDLYRTDDGGATWVQLNLETEFGIQGNVNSIGINTSQEAIYAGTDQGVFVSKDAGTDWQLCQTPNPDMGPETHIIIGSGQGPTVIYGLMSNGLYQSQDGGNSWVSISPQPTIYDANYNDNMTRPLLYLDQKDGELITVTPGGAVFVIR